MPVATPVTHYVNLVLDGNQTMALNDTILSVEGKIVVIENASLKLDNVKVRFIESELRHGFYVSGKGRLIAGNSVIRGQVRLNESAKLYSVNSTLYDSFYCTTHERNHTGGGLDAVGDSVAELHRTKIGVLWTHENARVRAENCDIYRTVSDEGHQEIVDSDVEINTRTVHNSVLDISIPDLSSYTGRLDFLPPVDTMFTNTTIEKMWLFVNNTRITLSDSSPELVYVYGDSDVVLMNCSVENLNARDFRGDIKGYDSEFRNIRLYFSNYTISLEDCDIEVAEIEWNLSVLNVTDCRIGSLVMEETAIEQVSYFKDTVIGELRPSLGGEAPAEYYMDNVTVTDGFWFNYGAWQKSSGLNIHGKMEILPEASLNRTIVDGYAIVNRFYPVYIMDNEEPVANVTISIRTANTTRTVGWTDIDGYIEVPVRYVSIFALVKPPAPPYLIKMRNMTDTVDLVWEINGEEGEIEISLRTKTPIIIQAETGRLLDRLIVPAIIVLVLVFVYMESRS